MSKKIKIGDCFEGDAGVPVLVCYGIDSNGWPILDDGWGDKVAANPDYFESIPTLHLPIGNDAKKYGGKWFDLILSGVKSEEYREVSDYNCKRLLRCSREVEYASWCEMMSDAKNFTRKPRHESMHALFGFFNISVKPWKVIHLTNGYNPKNQQLWAHIESISIGRGNPEWGAPKDRDVFIIRLGDVFHTKNLKQ